MLSRLAFQVGGLGFGDWSFGCRVHAAGCRVQGVRYGVEDMGFRVWGIGYGV